MEQERSPAPGTHTAGRGEALPGPAGYSGEGPPPFPEGRRVWPQPQTQRTGHRSTQPWQQRGCSRPETGALCWFLAASWVRGCPGSRRGRPRGLAPRLSQNMGHLPSGGCCFCRPTVHVAPAQGSLRLSLRPGTGQTPSGLPPARSEVPATPWKESVRTPGPRCPWHPALSLCGFIPQSHRTGANRRVFNQLWQKLPSPGLKALN